MVGVRGGPSSSSETSADAGLDVGADFIAGRVGSRVPQISQAGKEGWLEKVQAGHATFPSRPDGAEDKAGEDELDDKDGDERGGESWCLCRCWGVKRSFVEVCIALRGTPQR